MNTKNLLFTLIFTPLIQFSYTFALFTPEKTKIICNQLITIYKSNNNEIISDTFVSFIEQHDIENLPQLADVLKIGKEAYQTELDNIENLLSSNKLSLFLAQIVTWLSAIGYSHIYQSSSLNCSQSQENAFLLQANLNQLNATLDNTNNILNEANIELNDFNNLLKKGIDHLYDTKKYLYKQKNTLYQRTSTPLINDFQLTMDNYLLESETTITNYCRSIRDNQKSIDNNDLIISNNKSYMDLNTQIFNNSYMNLSNQISAFSASLEQFKLAYIPLFIAGVAYSSISLYDLYNKYQLRKNIFTKIDIIDRILKQIII